MQRSFYLRQRLKSDKKSALKIPSQTPLAISPTPAPPVIILSGLGEKQILLELFDAISEGKTEVVKVIMTYLDKPEALLKLKDLHGWTPLHFAVRGKHVKVVNWLLYAGADVYLKNKEDKTPLDLCDEGTPYRQILEVNDHALEDGPIDLCSSFIGRKQLNQIGPDGLLLFVTSALWSERMQFILSIRIRPYRADPPIPLQQDEQYISDRVMRRLHPRETRVKAYFLKVTSKARYIKKVPVRLSKYKQFGSYPNPPTEWDATRAEREKAVVDELMKKYMKEPEDEGTKDKDGEKEQGEAGEKEQGEAGEKEQGEAGEKEQGEAGEDEDQDPEENQSEANRPGTLMERDSSAGCTYGISRGLGYLALTVAVCFCLLHTTSAQWEKMPAELPSIGEVVLQIQEILQQDESLLRSIRFYGGLIIVVKLMGYGLLFLVAQNNLVVNDDENRGGRVQARLKKLFKFIIGFCVGYICKSIVDSMVKT